MTYAYALKTFFNYQVFLSEIFVSFLLVFSFLMLIFYFKKFMPEKFNSIGISIMATVLVFAITVIQWIISRFLNNVSTPIFLSPINLIVQSIVNGITKDFNGIPLLKGVWYILGAQILGGLLATLSFVGAFHLVNWITKNENNSNNNVKLQDIGLSTYQSNTKFAIKEMLFLFPFIALLPFVNVIINATYDTNAFTKLLISSVLFFIFLAFSQKMGYFSFNLIFTLSLLIIKAISKKLNFKHIFQTLIATIITTIFSILVPLIYLAMANINKIQFQI